MAQRRSRKRFIDLCVGSPEWKAWRQCHQLDGRPKKNWWFLADAETAAADGVGLHAYACPIHGFHIGHDMYFKKADTE